MNILSRKQKFYGNWCVNMWLGCQGVNTANAEELVEDFRQNLGPSSGLLKLAVDKNFTCFWKLNDIDECEYSLVFQLPYFLFAY